MKWFQHQSDASDDIKIKRLERKFGITGYAIFFKTLEKIAKEGEKYRLSLKKFPMEDLADTFGVEKKVLEDCLTFMNEISLIVLKKDEIKAPKMKYYASNWTKRNSVGTTEVRQSGDRATTAKEEKRREENKKEESVCSVLNDWNNRQPSPITDFKPQNIVKKHGADKVLSLIQEYGKQNGGFSKFMAALKPT